MAYKYFKKKKLGIMGVRKIYKSKTGKQFFIVKGKYYPVYPKKKRRK